MLIHYNDRVIYLLKVPTDDPPRKLGKVLVLLKSLGLVAMERGEMLRIELSYCDEMSSFSHRPLKRNLDLCEKKLDELLILGTSMPLLKLIKPTLLYIFINELFRISPIIYIRNFIELYK